MRLDKMKILRARINHLGVLEIYHRDQRGRYWIGRIHGNIEKIVRELEDRGIKVERDVQIRI